MKAAIFLCFIFIIKFSFSQTKLEEEKVITFISKSNENQIVNECSRLLQENYFHLAEIAADNLLRLKPESCNYNYRKGFILLESQLNWESAFPFLEKAVKNVDVNYDMYSSVEKSAPVDAYYHLGRCYHLDGDIENAQYYYNLFLKSTLPKSELKDDAMLRLKQCDVAKINFDLPHRVEVVNMGSTINSDNPEYSSIVSIDGKSLYFTSRRPWENNSTEKLRDCKLFQYPEDIYCSIKNDSGIWMKPERLLFCSPENNEASVTISIDERRIYSYNDISGGGDIFYSQINKRTLDNTVILEFPKINTRYWEPHCTVTPDGNEMYFVSDRPGGFGGRDIYRIIKYSNGEWSLPLNLGPGINSQYDEDAPFIATDNKSLYFASNSDKSMGGFDIFLSIKDENDNWSVPINLGYPMNSTADDVFYTTTSDGLTGYISSYRKGGLGEKDLYEIKNDFLGIKDVSILKGKIIMSDSSLIPESLFINLKCLNCDKPTSEIIIWPRLRDGAFNYVLESCRKYELSLQIDSISPKIYFDSFNSNCDNNYHEIYREYLLNLPVKRINKNIKYNFIARVYDNKSKLPIENASVSIIDKINNKNIVYKSDSTGLIQTNILNNFLFEDSTSFEIKISKSTYILQTTYFNERLGNNPDIYFDFYLDKPEIGIDVAKSINLSPIYFDFDKYNIRPDAEIELNKIVKLLEDYPQINIELRSHTDCRGSVNYNARLSNLRAISTAKYIQDRIKNPNRIYGIGYGESQLVNKCECEGETESNCTEIEHQENRRTEFQIVQK